MQGIFLDRDGVINKERADYVKCWKEFEFLPNSLRALERLAGFKIPTFIVTNQSVVGRNIVSVADIHEIHRQMMAHIQRCGLNITQVYMCPHHPDERCKCRKPEPGMLLSAAADYGLALSHCCFIGDSITDYQAARRCGCQSILVQSGRQGPNLEALLAESTVAEEHLLPSHVPIVEDLLAAVELLVR